MRGFSASSGFPAIWKMKCEAFQTDQTSSCGWWDCSELSRCFGEIVPRVRISLAKRFETADYLTKCGVSAQVRASIGVFYDQGYGRRGFQAHGRRKSSSPTCFCRNNGSFCFKFTAMRSFLLVVPLSEKWLFGRALKNARFLKGAACRLLV